MTRADELIGRLIGREGGYIDHPSDRGGETIWGITAAVARAFGYRGSMRAMPREEAARIYRERYWHAPGFDAVALRSELIAEELLDTGVNMGPAVAITFLQEALNGLNRQGRDYADIPIDGELGPKTLGALAVFLDGRGEAGLQVLLKALNVLQGARYFAISASRPANEDFLFGWLRTRIGAVA